MGYLIHMDYFVYSYAFMLLGVALYLSTALIRALTPTFYIGFLSHPHRQSCCGALMHVICVSIVMEIILVSKTLFYESKNVNNLLLKTDFLQETADSFPHSLVLTFSTRSREISLAKTSLETPFYIPMPQFYERGIDVLLTYFGTRYSMNPKIIKEILPNPRILFARNQREHAASLSKLKNREKTIFDNWWTVILNVDGSNIRMANTRQKIILFDELFEVDYDSSFNHMDTFIKLFCRKSISQSSGETKYKCTKSIVNEKLHALQKSLKRRSKGEKITAFYKRISPLFVICCISVTLMCTLTFLEAACAIFIMSIPAYIVCCVSLYRSYPGRGWPSYLGVIRLCSFTFTLYGFVWVIFGDLFAVKNFETVTDVGLYKDLIFVYVIWTFSACRQAIIPIVVMRRQQDLLNNFLARQGNQHPTNPRAIARPANATHTRAAGGIDRNDRSARDRDGGNAARQRNEHTPTAELTRGAVHEALQPSLEANMQHRRNDAQGQNVFSLPLLNQHYHMQIYQYYYAASLNRLYTEYYQKNDQANFRSSPSPNTGYSSYYRRSENEKAL